MTLTVRIHAGAHQAWLTMRCDTDDCAGAQTFTQENFAAQRAAATREGWVERQTNKGRVFYCPICAKTMKWV